MNQLKLTQRISIFTIGIIALYAIQLPSKAEANPDFLKSIELTDISNEADADQNQYQGYFQQAVKYGWQSPTKVFARNKPGISQVKTHLFFQGRGRTNETLQWQASIKGESEWLHWENNQSDWVNYNSEVYLKDFYFDATFDSGLWLRAGHQVIAWGESESLAITDVISPVDLREPGQTDLKDSRLQVPGILANYPLNTNINIISVITYKAKSSLYASTGDAFDVRSTQLPSDYILNESPVVNDWEFAAKLEGKFNGSDLSIMAARINDNNLSLEYIDEGEHEVVVSQNRFSVYGFNGNKVLGGGLLRAELALWKQAVTPTLYLTGYEKGNQVRSMLGYDYSIGSQWQLSLEFTNIHLPSNLAYASRKEATSHDHFGYFVRVQYSAFNDRLVNQFWVAKLGVEDAHTSNWSLSYDWLAKVKLELAVVSYHFGNRQSMLNLIENNDSINVSLKFTM